MDSMLVTIGIPTFNRAESLQRYSLPSIEKLNYPRYEVVVIDDCSSDKTPEILDSYRQRLPEFRFFRNKKNRGVCYSRNRILEESRGDIIVFFDDDVSLFPDCLDEIVKLYSQDPECFFAWGCVYQCHSSHDKNKPTFGTGSLFSVRHIVAKHFRFDTNIRYFKTFGCEEQEFARRVQRANVKLLKASTARANHHHAPSKNRPWRGLGGDLNYLYETVKVKRGSIAGYYKSLILGLHYEIQRFLKHDKDFEALSRQDTYTGAVRACHHCLVQLREGRFIVASKYFFYVIADIPLRAWARSKIDAEQACRFIQELEKNNGKRIKAELAPENQTVSAD